MMGCKHLGIDGSISPHLVYLHVTVALSKLAWILAHYGVGNGTQ